MQSRNNNKNNNNNFKRGFTLIETIVAVSLIVLVIVGPLTLAIRSLAAYRKALDNLRATAFAEEGIELIRSVRNNNASQGKDWLEHILTGAGVNHCDTGCLIDPFAAKFEDIIQPCSTASCASDDVRLYVNDAEQYRQQVPPPSGVWRPSRFSRTLVVNVVEPDKEVRITAIVKWDKGEKKIVSELYSWFPDFTKF
jgi:type II secretory pathway pseudopilin PulG